MLQRKTQTERYWVEEFQVEQEDIDHLYNVLLETEVPLSIDEMALVLVRHRIQREEKELVQRARRENIYQPRCHYEIGDEVIFSAPNIGTGKVISQRSGENPDYGDYTVISVEFTDGSVLEFASALAIEHALNIETGEDARNDNALRSSEEIFIEYGGEVADALEEHLANHDDLVRLAGRWFPRSLLADVHVGHLNLAEAVLDVHGGGPLSTPEILNQIGMLDGVNDRLAEFSMNYGLQQDERFDEVGPAGQVLWFLKRMEPDNVLNPPQHLVYTSTDYNPELLTGELQELETEIGDEHTIIPKQRQPRPESVALRLIYPHRRAGTLPLSPQLRRMFPTAYEAPRIRFTLVDAENKDEIPAWVVRPGGYVYGLGDWFERHDIPVGGHLTISRMDRPGKVEISYAKRNPRIEWVRTAVVEGNRLKIENKKESIGCDYDDLMIVRVEDPEAVDELGMRLESRKTTLEHLMLDLARELAALTPQGHIHAKTLYCVVNVIRRYPPGPIFAALVAMPQFEHVGGPYWHIIERA